MLSRAIRGTAQHGLQNTPAEQKNVKAVAETFRQEDGGILVTAIQTLK